MKNIYKLTLYSYLTIIILLLTHLNSFAQCSNKKVKATITPIVGVSNGYSEGQNHIAIAGYSVTDEVKITFPISYELRQGSETGTVVSQGVFTEKANFNNFKSRKNSNNLHSGKYYLISCDSSSPQKYSVQPYTIEKNKKQRL